MVLLTHLQNTRHTSTHTPTNYTPAPNIYLHTYTRHTSTYTPTHYTPTPLLTHLSPILTLTAGSSFYPYLIRPPTRTYYHWSWQSCRSIGRSDTLTVIVCGMAIFCLWNGYILSAEWLFFVCRMAIFCQWNGFSKSCTDSNTIASLCSSKASCLE